MASVEFIQKRIEGKKSELDKLRKKLERIEIARSHDYNDHNPYYYNERDYTYTLRDIERAEEAIKQYETDLDTENKKSASRNVPAITEFLDRWENNTVQYYRDAYERYLEARKEYYQKDSELVDKWNRSYQLTREERAAISKQERELRHSFETTWSFVTQFNSGSGSWDANMQKAVSDEKRRKYDFIVERVTAIVGQITDASNLRVGAKGDLNGYIDGTDGRAHVETVGAGGYNQGRIVNEKHGQIFHFRTLIKPVKKED